MHLVISLDNNGMKFEVLYHLMRTCRQSGEYLEGGSQLRENMQHRTALVLPSRSCLYWVGRNSYTCPHQHEGRASSKENLQRQYIFQCLGLSFHPGPNGRNDILNPHNSKSNILNRNVTSGSLDYPSSSSCLHYVEVDICFK